MMKTLSIVIPCWNEEEAAAAVLQNVSKVREHFLNQLGFQDVQVVVVDDASQDSSVEIIQRFPFIELHRHSQNLGYGASLRTGFEKSRGRWICFFDMDHTYPPELLPSMWEFLNSQNLDIVSGRRAFKSEGMSMVRGFGNWMFSVLTKLFLGTQIQDVCSGYRIFKRECLPDILAITEDSLGFSLEMSIKLPSLGFTTREFEINYLPRKGQSKLSVWKDGWNFLLLILNATRKMYFNNGARS